jgi:hypothetical protein
MDRLVQLVLGHQANRGQMEEEFCIAQEAIATLSAGRPEQVA